MLSHVQQYAHLAIVVAAARPTSTGQWMGQRAEDSLQHVLMLLLQLNRRSADVRPWLLQAGVSQRRGDLVHKVHDG